MKRSSIIVISLEEGMVSLTTPGYDLSLSPPIIKNIYYGDKIKIAKIFKELSLKKFITLEEVCLAVQELINDLKYNLKRNHTRGNQRGLTFVCSCISRKKTKRTKREKEANSYEETNECDRSEGSDCMSGSLKNSDEPKRKIKRTNNHACRFRLKFKWVNELNAYKMREDSYLVHNHEPETNSITKEFSKKSRNIKFPLCTIHEIMTKIVKEAQEFMILDKHFFAEVRDGIFDKLNIQGKNEKQFKTNYKKKLGYFIETLSFELLTLKFSEFSLDEIYLHLYYFLLKKGANYLRQDSLQTLISAMDEFKKFEGEINFEEYIQNKFVEK